MGNTLIAPARTRTVRTASWGHTLARAYDEHAAAVYGLARLVTQDDDVAARLTAEVFAGLDDITDEAALAECVVTDAHRRAVAWVRAAATVSDTSGGEPALATLPAIQRQVIAAAYFDGMTYAEIGHRLAMDLGEVVDHMQRGLRRLAALSPGAPAR